MGALTALLMILTMLLVGGTSELNPSSIALVGSLLTFYGTYTSGYIRSTTPDKRDEIAWIRRYEEQAAESVSAILSVEGRSMFGLRDCLRLAHPPPKPETVQWASAFEESDTKQSKDRKKYVCTCISKTLRHETMRRDLKVRLIWVKAKSADVAFNSVARSLGLREVSCVTDLTNQSAAYGSDDFLVLIEPARCNYKKSRLSKNSSQTEVSCGASKEASDKVRPAETAEDRTEETPRSRDG